MLDLGPEENDIIRFQIEHARERLSSDQGDHKTAAEVEGLSFISYFMPTRSLYARKRTMRELLTRDPTLLQLIKDTISGPPEAWDWGNVRRYPAFKQTITPSHVMNYEKALFLFDNEHELHMDFERYRMSANDSIERPLQSLDVFPPALYVMFTFVRHADYKSTGQQFWDTSKPDEPTSRGEGQLERLPMEWKDVPIDAIYSSDKVRAYETAKAIASGASDPPKEVIQRGWLTEKDHGPKAAKYRLEGNDDAAYYARTGIWCDPYSGSSSDDSAGQIRFFVPEGGESEHDAAHRAQAEILSLLLKHGVPLTEEDKVTEWDNVVEVEYQWDDYNKEWKADLGLNDTGKIPHVMIVSHNLFLTELYESLCYWNSSEHVQTGTEYKNTGWTRHLMRLTWPYDKTDWDKYSHGAKWFGLNVEKKDIKAPSGSSQTLGRYSHGRAPVHRTVPKYY